MVWPRLRAWVDAEPHRTGKELFQRLRAEYPNQVPDSQLRTLQRPLKEWRTGTARGLLFATDTHDDASVTNDDQALVSYDRRLVGVETAGWTTSTVGLRPPFATHQTVGSPWHRSEY